MYTNPTTLQVLEASEAWDYPEWSQYDSADIETGLFTQYVNAFLKLKQEASGKPDWVGIILVVIYPCPCQLLVVVTLINTHVTTSGPNRC